MSFFHKSTNVLSLGAVVIAGVTAGAYFTGFGAPTHQSDCIAENNCAEVGATGEAGATGATGATGAVGAVGVAGADGKTIALNSANISGNLVPTIDNAFTIGTSKLRWRNLQLGPGTLFIQDGATGKQAGLTVVNGALLLDGADSLRLGNTRLTTTGIASILSGEDITIGAKGDTGYLSTARGIKFPDGTVQSSAAIATKAGVAGATGAAGATGTTGAIGTAGATGARGLQGIQGIQGIQGLTGLRGATGEAGPQGAEGTFSGAGYIEVAACVANANPDERIIAGTMFLMKCGDLRGGGTNITILQRKE